MRSGARPCGRPRRINRWAGSPSCAWTGSSVNEPKRLPIAVSSLCSSSARKITVSVPDGFSTAAAPEEAERVFNLLVQACRDRHRGGVETGRFGAHMMISLVNDGPVTFLLQA